MKRPAMECVVWNDASSGDAQGWVAHENVQDEATEVTSVGWVVKETAAFLTLAMDLLEDGTSNTRGRIPLGMIISRRVLV